MFFTHMWTEDIPTGTASSTKPSLILTLRSTTQWYRYLMNQPTAIHSSFLVKYSSTTPTKICNGSARTLSRIICSRPGYILSRSHWQRERNWRVGSSTCPIVSRVGCEADTQVLSPWMKAIQNHTFKGTYQALLTRSPGEGRYSVW